MSDSSNWKPSYIFIAICIFLLALLVYVMGESLRHGVGGSARLTEEQPVIILEEDPTEKEILAEASPFIRRIRLSKTPTPSIPGASFRDLEKFYGLRAYPGAPPYIPHPVEPDMAVVEAPSCLSCHKEGGYVAQFNAYAPITPHPELISCRQCHVESTDKGLFKATTWQKIRGPKLGRSALPNSPPPIPHGFQMRENCIACHGGPAAVTEIASSHPERINCRQCHVPTRSIQEWSRR